MNSFLSTEQRRVMIAIASVTGTPWLEVPLAIQYRVPMQSIANEAMLPLPRVMELYEQLLATGELVILRQPPIIGGPRNKTRELSARRLLVFERDGWECLYCGTTDDLTIDHMQPTSRGGTNEKSNLATACAACNRLKSDAMPCDFIFQYHR